jgi:UPF0755 protein
MLNKPLGRILLGLVVTFVVVAGWFALQFEPVFHGKGKVVIVVVHSNESISSIAAALHDQHVIASPFAFRMFAETIGSFKVPASGKDEFTTGSSFLKIRSILGSLPNVPSVTVAAGQTLYEVEGNLANAEGVSYANAFTTDVTQSKTPSPFSSAGSLEGLIGTGTYFILPGESPATLAKKMVEGFVKESSSVGLTPTTTLNGLNAYQLVIAASIVEKEGYYPVNMPQVARVIFNRLARGGPLQMDATVLYYLKQDGGTVTPAMLQTQEPYNTYLNVGLTPTPICAVSTIALRAILHAPAGSWLYFTLINKDGTMAFSTTFAQQLHEEKIAESRGIG